MHLRLSRNLMKKILLCLLTFSGYLLGIAFFIHSQSLFLETMGPEQMPFVMVVGALLVITYSLLSSAIGSRLSSPLRFAIFTILISAFYGVIYLLPENVPLQVILFFLTSGFFFDFLDVSVINLASSLMTPLQAKNMLPLLSSFTALGVIFGSYFALDIQLYSEKIGVGLLQAMSLLIVVLFALLVVKVFKKDLKQSAEALKAQKTELQHTVRDAAHFIRHSNLFRSLAFVVFLFVAIRVSLEFKLKTTMSLNFSGSELTDLFGKIYMVESALAFLVNFFITERFISRFGIVKTLLLYPVTMFVFGCVAVVSGLQPLYVVLFTMSCTIPWYSLVVVSTSQVFSIAPKQRSQQVYFLIMGLLSSLTKLAIALSLFVYTANIELEKPLNTGLIFFFVMILFVTLWKFKNYFQIELKDNLFKDDLYLKHQTIELMAEKTQKNQGELHLRRLLGLSTTDEQTKIKTMNTLGMIGNYQTVTDFIKILKEGSPKEMFVALQNIGLIVKSRRKFNRYPLTKHLLLKTYREIFISNVPHYVKLEIISSLKYFNLEEVIDFLEKNLQSEDVQVKKNVIETLDSFNDRGIILYLELYLESKDAQIVASTIAALWKFPDMRINLVPKLAEIMAEESVEARDSTLYLIASIHAYWEKAYVQKLCDARVAHTRRYAYITLLFLGDNSYLDALVRELADLAKSVDAKGENFMTDKQELEFILSQYRKLNRDLRELIIAKIQQLQPNDVHVIFEAFLHSRYMFVQELDDLRV